MKPKTTEQYVAEITGNLAMQLAGALAERDALRVRVAELEAQMEASKAQQAEPARLETTKNMTAV